MLARPSPLVETIIGCAIAVHRELGPGLFESAYTRCLEYEFTTAGLGFDREVAVPIAYKGAQLNCGYRVDFIVEETVLVEVKSLVALLPVHHMQVLTYLKFLHLHQGLLFNFNAPRLIDGLRSVLV